MQIDEIQGAAPDMPVVTFDDLAKAAPLARALAAGGLRAIEVTLRTPQALEAVRIIAGEVPEALPGVGTVLSGRDLEAAAAAGAKFAVSPGHHLSLALAAALEDQGLLHICRPSPQPAS